MFFATYSLVLMYILNNLFCCLQVSHQFYLSSFPLFCRMQHYSLICTMFFHLCLDFSPASILFFVLNSTYSFSHCDWLNYNMQCNFLVLILVSKNLWVFLMKHILIFIKKIRHQFFNIANRNMVNIRNL